MDLPVIRPVCAADFDAIYALARAAGGGMTNLPADEEALRARVDFAIESFGAEAVEPGPEVYMMVLEHGGKVVGTGAVFSSIGLASGFVNYKVNQTFLASKPLNKRIRRRVLVTTHDFTGAAEVGSLYLAPTARGGGLGKFLARTRYLFIAQKPEIVGDRICAELRGWRAPDGRQPFWEAIGRHFFEMDFEEADVHNAANGNQFIADLMPRHPIYVTLLPDDARACIGRPHDNARPAYEMLLREGFAYADYIDIFDGGPLLTGVTNEIKSIKQSVCAKIDSTPTTLSNGDDAIIAVGAVARFRAVRARIDVRRPPDGGGGAVVDLAKDAAAALGVGPGDEIRFVKW